MRKPRRSLIDERCTPSLDLYVLFYIKTNKETVKQQETTCETTKKSVLGSMCYYFSDIKQLSKTARECSILPVQKGVNQRLVSDILSRKRKTERRLKQHVCDSAQ